MSEFKEGDEVYFLIEEHGWGSSPIFIGNLNIRKEKITECHYDFLQCTHLEGISHKDTLYKSKNEAIDAMIKRLESMRNE